MLGESCAHYCQQLLILRQSGLGNNLQCKLTESRSKRCWMDRTDKVRLKTGWSKLEKKSGTVEGSTTCASHSRAHKTASMVTIRNKLQTYLARKYAASSKLYYLKVMDSLLKGTRDSASIRLKYDLDVSTSSKTLKRYYKVHESVARIEQMSEYFKYHYEIPRLFLPKVVDVIDSFHDRKRNKIYQDVKRMIGKENIVGDDSEQNQSSLDQQAKHKGGYGFIFVGDELERLRDGFDTSQILDQKDDTLKVVLGKLNQCGASQRRKPGVPSLPDLSMSGLSHVIDNQIQEFRSYLAGGFPTDVDSPKRTTQKPKIQISHRLVDKLTEITQMGSGQGMVPKPALKMNISPRMLQQSTTQQESLLRSPTRLFKQSKPSLLIGENTTMFGKSRVSQPSVTEVNNHKDTKLAVNPSMRGSQLGMTSSSTTVNVVPLGAKKTSAEWLNKGWFKTLGSENRSSKSPYRITGAPVEPHPLKKNLATSFKKEIEQFHRLQSGSKTGNRTLTGGLTNSFKDLRNLAGLHANGKSVSPTINVVRSARIGQESFNLLNLDLAGSAQKSATQNIQMRRFKTQGSQGYIKEGSYQIDSFFSPKATRDHGQQLFKSKQQEGTAGTTLSSSQRVHNFHKSSKVAPATESQPTIQNRFEQRSRISLTNVVNSSSPRDMILVRRMKSEDRSNTDFGRTKYETPHIVTRMLQGSTHSNSNAMQQTHSGVRISTSPNRNPSFTVQQMTSTLKGASHDSPGKIKSTSHWQSSSINKGVLANPNQLGHMSHKSNAARVGQQSYKSPPNQLLSLLPQSALGRTKMLGSIKVRNV